MMMMMKKKMATGTKEEAWAETYVYWDMKMFPVSDTEAARKFGPCMKRFLKKHHGYFGPITINAFGVLTDYHVDILRALSLNGITLTYSPYVTSDISVSVLRIVLAKPPPPSPPPNFILLIDPMSSDSSIVDKAIHWQDFIRTLEEEEEEYMSTTTETDESANNDNNNWCCFICNRLSGQGFDSFISHFSSPQHAVERLQWLPVHAYKRREKFFEENEVPFTTVWKRSEEVSSAVTSVFWDLSMFPVPSGFDPLLVVQRIKRLMVHLGYSLLPTIYAFNPPDKEDGRLFQALSSNGVLFIPSCSHCFSGTETIKRLVNDFIRVHGPAATLLSICDPALIPKQPCEGYTLFRPFSRDEACLWGKFIRADIVSTEEYNELREDEEEFKFEEEEGGGRPDTRHIIMDVGLNFYVEFTRKEALDYISQREERIKKRLKEVSGVITHQRTHQTGKSKVVSLLCNNFMNHNSYM
ncbi:unnamed protein product [Cochlearia groenlandica]